MCLLLREDRCNKACKGSKLKRCPRVIVHAKLQNKKHSVVIHIPKCASMQNDVDTYDTNQCSNSKYILNNVTNYLSYKCESPSIVILGKTEHCSIMSTCPNLGLVGSWTSEPVTQATGFPKAVLVNDILVVDIPSGRRVPQATKSYMSNSHDFMIVTACSMCAK